MRGSNVQVSMCVTCQRNPLVPYSRRLVHTYQIMNEKKLTLVIKKSEANLLRAIVGMGLRPSADAIPRKTLAPNKAPDKMRF